MKKEMTFTRDEHKSLMRLVCYNIMRIEKIIRKLVPGSRYKIINRNLTIIDVFMALRKQAYNSSGDYRNPKWENKLLMLWNFKLPLIKQRPEVWSLLFGILLWDGDIDERTIK